MEVMGDQEEAGTLVVEAAIITPIIAFSHLVDPDSSFTLLSIESPLIFKWIIPLLIYFFYLLRVFSIRKGNVRKSNSLVPFISSLSEIGVIYVIYGVTSKFFIFPTAVFIVVSLASVALIIIEYWINKFSSFAEFAEKESRKEASDSHIPFLENIASVSQNIDMSQDMSEIRISRKDLIYSFAAFIIMAIVVIVTSIIPYLILRFVYLEISFLTVAVTFSSLLFLKTVFSYLLSEMGYGSVRYRNILFPWNSQTFHRLISVILILTINTYLTISLMQN